MNKKIWKAITLVSILLLLGCEEKKNGEPTSIYKDLIVEKDESVKKHLDESRLVKDKNYTYDEAIQKFSFILYKNYWEKDILENDEFIYSFTSTENVKLSTGGVTSYRFKRTTDSSYGDEMSISLVDYTKDNYKEKIKEDNYEIIKEEDEYVFMKYNNSDTSFYSLKFFSDGSCLSGYVSIYSSEITDKESTAIEIMKEVFDTITLDNGEPILQDKMVTLKNYDNKTPISAEYIGDIDTYEKSMNISHHNLSLTVDFEEDDYHLDGPWKILSPENPYIVMNNDMIYKVVNNGMPEYYSFEEYDETTYENKTMGGNLEDFQVLINLFYE